MNVAHRYAVGDRVEIRRLPHQAGADSGPYTIVRQLPNDGRDREYRVKSVQGGQERVVLESALVASADSAPDRLFR